VTILTDVPDGCPAAEKELFGPAATVTTVPDESAAVRVANDTDYGLGASVWTGDSDRGEALVPAIEAGNVFANQIVQSDPRLPFGGIKQSGYGSELSKHGTREFANEKTVWVEQPPPVVRPSTGRLASLACRFASARIVVLTSHLWPSTRVAATSAPRRATAPRALRDRAGTPSP
jgi:hypothetical protein